MDAYSYGTMATSAYSAYQQYEAGKDAQEAYNAQARQVALDQAYVSREALDQQRDIGREGRAMAGQAVAKAGGKGLRVAGSVVTLTQAIARSAERQKSRINLKYNQASAQASFEMGRLRLAGQRARKTGTTQAYGSLLTGGLKAYNHMSQRGYSGSEMLFGRD